MDRSTTGRVLLAVAAIFLILMILLPLAYPYGSFIGLDGRPGVIENWDKTAFADPVTRFMYAIGDLFCHQEQARTFLVNGSQMAFCQRDVSLLSGFVIGLLITDLLSKKVHLGSKIIFIIGIILTITTVIEWLVENTFDVDLLAARTITGILSGTGLAALVQFFVTRQYEKIMGLR